jgi:flagellar biosynthesis component FlhA
MFEIAAFLFWFIVIFFMIAIIVVTPILNVIALICVLGFGGLMYQEHRDQLARTAKYTMEQQASEQQRQREQRERQIAWDQEQVRLQEERRKQQIKQEAARLKQEYAQEMAQRKQMAENERRMALMCASAHAAEHFVSCLEWQRSRP